MFGMRFAIDVVFLDRADVVTRVSADLRPWRVAAAKGSRKVVELPAGRARELDLAVGDELRFGAACEGQAGAGKGLGQA